MDYMDLDVRCSQKAVKLNHSLTHSSISNVTEVCILLVQLFMSQTELMAWCQ